MLPDSIGYTSVQEGAIEIPIGHSIDIMFAASCIGFIFLLDTKLVYSRWRLELQWPIVNGQVCDAIDGAYVQDATQSSGRHVKPKLRYYICCCRSI